MKKAVPQGRRINGMGRGMMMRGGGYARGGGVVGMQNATPWFSPNSWALNALYPPGGANGAWNEWYNNAANYYTQAAAAAGGGTTTYNAYGAMNGKLSSMSGTNFLNF